MLRILSLLALLAGCAYSSVIRAETTLCTNILSLPAVITVQGVYCLKQDLTTSITSGAAITINTNNVTIDCNDWKVGGLAAGASTDAAGIYASARQNITIRHCGIRGFFKGIQIEGTSTVGHLIEDNRVDLNTFNAISAAGDGVIIRRNRLVDTGGRPATSYATALVVKGSAFAIHDNLIAGVSAAGADGFGDAIGIDVYGTDMEMSRNLITGLTTFGPGTARGIYGANFAVFRDNSIIGATGLKGIAIDANSLDAICTGNITRGFVSGIVACTDAGGNLSN